MSEARIVVEGRSKKIEVYDSKVRIAPAGLLGAINTMAGNGGCEVPIKSISSIEFSEASFLAVGFIILNYAGAQAGDAHSKDKRMGNNAITFGGGANAEMKKAKELIEQLMKSAGSGGTASAADEIKKFADLKAQGIISADDFEKKKKELLGL